jgi:RNA polymerase sigma-70 factor (ECF subfamily)
MEKCQRVFFTDTLNDNMMENSTQLPDTEIRCLLQRCLDGDAMGQKKVYNQFFPYCLRVCSFYIKNDDDLAEVVNDGFVKVFRQLPRFDLSSRNLVFSLQGWMKRIMINTAIDHLRKYKHYLSASFVGPEGTLLSATEDPVDYLGYKRIIAAIAKVSPGYRVVFRLYFLRGCTHREIAGLLDITISTSKSNLLKARRQLKKFLIDET